MTADARGRAGGDTLALELVRPHKEPTDDLTLDDHGLGPTAERRTACEEPHRCRRLRAPTPAIRVLGAGTKAVVYVRTQVLQEHRHARWSAGWR